MEITSKLGCLLGNKSSFLPFSKQRCAFFDKTINAPNNKFRLQLKENQSEKIDYQELRTMTTKTAEKAIELFLSGFNCAEATLFALSEEFDKETTVIPRIATGFGGGIGRTGQICGTLGGAIMAIGLQIGCDKAEEKEKRDAAIENVQQLIIEFEKEFGASKCEVLTQCDLQTKGGQEKFGRQDLRKNLCPRFIRWTVDYVVNKYG